MSFPTSSHHMTTRGSKTPTDQLNIDITTRSAFGLPVISPHTTAASDNIPAPTSLPVDNLVARNFSRPHPLNPQLPSKMRSHLPKFPNIITQLHRQAFLTVAAPPAFAIPLRLHLLTFLMNHVTPRVLLSQRFQYNHLSPLTFPYYRLVIPRYLPT